LLNLEARMLKSAGPEWTRTSDQGMFFQKSLFCFRNGLRQGQICDLQPDIRQPTCHPTGKHFQLPTCTNLHRTKESVALEKLP